MAIGENQTRDVSPAGEKPLDPEICWELLHRVTAGANLKKAPRLQELLLFVGRCALKDGRDHLPEQEIGAKVFGRPREYDTSADNIVRTNISDLRKRIHGYFQEEGLHEPIVMEIPRGSYMPVFRFKAAIETGDDNHSAVPNGGQSPPTDIPLQSASGRFSGYRSTLALGIAVAILACACAALAIRTYSLEKSLYRWKTQPAVERFWSPFLAGDRNTDLVVGDSSFAIIQDFDKQAFSLQDYASRNYIHKLHETDPRLLAAMNRIYGWGLVSSGEFDFSRRLLAMDPLGQKLSVFNARSFDANLIKRDNVILLGSRYVNPWVELFDHQMNFTFVPENPNLIVNRAPARGEQNSYTWPEGVGYCIVASLPTPDNASSALLIEGTSSEATEAAADFLFSEQQMEILEKRTGTKPLPYFELLLRTSWIKGIAYDTHIVAYRRFTPPN